LTIKELKIRHIQKLHYETVLVMQGGGSLGAYECGVYKALHRHGVRFDVIAGTSIGAVNAGIIAGSKSGDPASDLENFWLDVANKVAPPLAFMSDLQRAIIASATSAIYGNPRAFSSLWLKEFYQLNPFSVFKPNLYDLEPLKETLANYVDFEKLNDAGRASRLVLTCTDIRNAEPVIFDSKHTRIDQDHLAACASFPFYGIAWTEKDGRYLWDGALLSNTPLREVIEASPNHDKKVYVVNLFPRVQRDLPQSLLDAMHRARDIMYSDKTEHNVRMSNIISRYLLLLKEMHDILNNVELKGEMRDRFLKIEEEYHKIACERGAIIDKIIRIERTEDVPFLFEDADFSLETIRKLIQKGEDDAEEVLNKEARQNTVS